MDDFEKELIEAQEQRSDAWRDARCGKFTASEIFKLMSNPRSKSAEWSESAMTYIKTKVAEEITGYIHQASNAYPLVWGEDQEPIAKEVITNKKGYVIERAGFIAFTDHSGGTPDGFVNGDLIEIKCPYNPANHIEYMMLKMAEDLLDFKPENYYQCQANMLFAKKDGCKFFSYDGRFPEDKMLVELYLKADTECQAKILERLERAIEKKIELVKQFK